MCMSMSLCALEQHIISSSNHCTSTTITMGTAVLKQIVLDLILLYSENSSFAETLNLSSAAKSE
jgi:hypothetical protein